MNKISAESTVPELVAPAGDAEKLKIALHYGADAVYLGAPGLNLRAYTSGFSLEDIKEAVTTVHQNKRKIYIALNIFAHNRHLDDARLYLSELASCNVDGFIISDPGILALARQYAPQIPIHLSTQAGVTNILSARFWGEQGVKRIVPARELTLEELKRISEESGIELEVFVHGAMCIAYSGRCLISAYFNAKSGNRGECKQPCRWGYRLTENQRPADSLILHEEDGESFILSSRDLNMIRHIPELIEAGISAFKIEGRMKGIHYLATVVRAYRETIDRYLADPDIFEYDTYWDKELDKVSHRPYHTGFFFGSPEQVGPDDKKSYSANSVMVGVVIGYDSVNNMATIEQRNRFMKGDILEVLSPKERGYNFEAEKITDFSGTEMESAPHAQQIIRVPVKKELYPLDILRLPLNAEESCANEQI